MKALAAGQMSTTKQGGERQLVEFEKCRLSGEIGLSFSHLSLALLLSPHLKQQYYSTYLEIFEKWSQKAEDSHGLSQVMTLYEVALNHYPESPDLHYLLAATLYRHGSVHEAWNHACLAEAKCPRDPCAQDIQGRLANCLVDRWHLPMLNDAGRNAAFRMAITEAVREGYNTVLDIGSGTGLLSIYALWAGAKEVYACEEDTFMSEICSSVLQMNRNATAIQILNKHSKDILIPSDIPQKVSLVVSETVDAGLFGEHILSTLQHAWQHLLLPPQKSENDKTTAGVIQTQLSPCDTSQASGEQLCKYWQRDDSSRQEDDSTDSVTNLDHINVAKGKITSQEYGRVIPARAEVYVALISCSYVAKQTKYLNSDIECLKNKYVNVRLEEPYMSEKLSCVPGGFKLLSEWIQVTTVDFNSLNDITNHLTGEVSKIINFKCIEDGTVDAIVLAFNLYLDEKNCIRTFPDSVIQTVWENAVYPVVYPLSIASEDTVTLDFQCCGVIRLAVQNPTFSCSSGYDSVNLSTNALRFLNSRSFVDEFLSAAHQVFFKVQQCKNKNKSSNNHPLIICDTLPFPVAGLCLQSLQPDSQLYVEDEAIQKVLQELGIAVKLYEEIQEETLDVLFIWPLTEEGTLIDGIMEKAQSYSLLMAKDSIVFPQELELVMDIFNSPVLEACTHISDDNTCGVAVARVFNMVQTKHHLDVALSSLPHTSSVLTQVVPMLRISLVSGQTETLVKPQESLTLQDASRDLLVLGGKVAEVMTCLTVTQDTKLTSLPYWFNVRGNIEQALPDSSAAMVHSENGVVLSTLSEDSPCNQSVFMLKQPLEVTAGEKVMLRVLWRGGVFSATLDRCQQSDDRD
ncbi:protein arginine N-methyltransferase 9-like isoform X1 [Scylla paramamosain]|uniref:protein arginine N-methyltransferase 9-like isoform X1 n=1 Tax=Scylla paramamosain TaxID=85552 RepID=UPI003082DF56